MSPVENFEFSKDPLRECFFCLLLTVQDVPGIKFLLGHHGH